MKIVYMLIKQLLRGYAMDCKFFLKCLDMFSIMLYHIVIDHYYLTISLVHEKLYPNNNELA